jgi:hypothetical protein
MTEVRVATARWDAVIILHQGTDLSDHPGQASEPELHRYFRHSGRATVTDDLTITRTFDAPRELVYVDPA